MLDDNYYMGLALREAQKAYDNDEVPVGAIIVCENKIIGKGYNQVKQLRDATAHAEMIAITAASNYLGNKYLQNCTLYVTLEPCVMCGGAMQWTQVQRIVYGASDPRGGFSKLTPSVLHPKTQVLSGIMEEDCSAMLKRFFLSKR
jgi:tRNA(adenine34) deaminase